MDKQIDSGAAWVEIDNVRHPAEIVERSVELERRGPSVRKARPRALAGYALPVEVA